MNHEQLITKYRSEREKRGDSINESNLLGDKYPHCLLVIEGAQELMKMKACDRLAQDYLDTLLLRLVVSLISFQLHVFVCRMAQTDGTGIISQWCLKAT